MHISLDGRESSLDNLVLMGRKFFDKSGFRQWWEFDPDVFAETVTRLAESEDGLILEAEDAMAGCMSYPLWFNPSQRTAQELFWWNEGKWEMLRKMEAWALFRGCVTLEMGCLEDLRPEVMTRFYRMRGYAPKERLFVKWLDQQ